MFVTGYGVRYIVREIRAKVHKETRDGTYFIVLVPHENLTSEIAQLAVNGVLSGELRLDDGRTITALQRKKVYATIKDIAYWNGDVPEDLKEHLKYMFIAATERDYFSLSDCSMETARHFITHILDLALEMSIPLTETLIDRTDDIDAAIYSSLKHRCCIICGLDGEIRHFDDSKSRKLCLCRVHHGEAHSIGKKTFEEKYHVYGIIYNE